MASMQELDACLLEDDFLSELANDLSTGGRGGLPDALAADVLGAPLARAPTQPIAIETTRSLPLPEQARSLPPVGALSAPEQQAFTLNGSFYDPLLLAGAAPLLIPRAHSFGVLPPLGFALGGSLPSSSPASTSSQRRGFQEDEKEGVGKRSKGAAAQARFRHRQKAS
jgi:hypothetical protein